MSVMTEPEVPARSRDTAKPRARKQRGGRHSISMRDLTKLTGDDLVALTEPLPVTRDGLPLAWLVPMTPGERKRAELIAAGRLRPATRPGGLLNWKPLEPVPGERPLSEILLEMRDQEHT